jgi:transcriptional regulator with XRE-family HTH domain
MASPETFLAALEQQNLTISELARRLGASRARLSEALRGERRATLAYWMDVGAELGLGRREVHALLEPYAARRGCMG